MNTLQEGQRFTGKDGETVRIGKIDMGTAGVTVEHADGSTERFIIALDEWPLMVEHGRLTAATS